LNFSFASKRTFYATAAILLGGSVLPLHSQTGAPLELKQTIALPGVEGRIDHFDIDVNGERLFVCALGNNTVEVIDLSKGERTRTISGLGAPQGVSFVPGLNRLVVANDNGGLCNIYDAKSFQQIGKLDFKDDADNVRYDSVAKRVYVGFGSGGIGIISAADGKQIGSIKLTAHPEAFALEKQGQRMFVNVPNARQVAVIDREKGQVITTWGTDGAFGNFPVALDEINHRLFVGCRIPAKLIVLDSESGKAVAKIGVSGDPDDVYYDSKRHRIYVVCGAGKIDIIEQSDPNNYKAVTKIDTASGTRTGLFVPERDTLFVAVPHRGSQQAEIRCFQVK
jgi:DNA-binding beta-propeller fold protein YncE